MTTLAINPNDFIHALLRWSIDRANAATTPAGTLSYLTPPRALARNVGSERDGADPMTVVRSYAGSAWMYSRRVPRVSLQWQTSGTDDEAAFAQAQLFCETLLDADGLPIRDTIIPGHKSADDSADGNWRLVGIDVLQRPGLIGRDDRGRPAYAFNCETTFLRS